MYYRKTKNKLLACIILLALVMFMFSNNTSLADTSVPPASAFCPWNVIGSELISQSSDYYDSDYISLLNVESARDAVHDEVPLPTAENNNKILIYHTHTNEAYLESDESRFINLASRSQNAAFTVQEVGKALKNEFAVLGIDSDHDTTNNEAQGYKMAYKMSYASVDTMIEQNGDYIAYLDVHRDAYIANTVPTVTINGESVARIMLVVGGQSPHAEQNHAFARAIMEELNKIHPQLCEKVLYVQSSKYNRIEADNCVIVEVGDNNVTVSEACRAAHYVALAISKVLQRE